MKETIRDEHGRVIGYKLIEESGATYLNPSGHVISRVRNETTLDSTGAVRGKGDQGLRLYDND